MKWDSKIFLTIDELAEYLNEAVGTIREWVLQRRIPFYKRGRRLQFKLQEIIKWDEERNHVLPHEG